MVTDEIKKWVKEWVAGWSRHNFFHRSEHQQTSSGTSSGAKPPLLNYLGKLDSSFYDLTAISDANFTLVDDGDNTKKLQFQLSGISAVTTRTITVPNASGTLALIDLAQAWTAIQTFITGTAVGDGTGSATFSINGIAGQLRSLTFRTAGVTRWVLRANNTAESGSNVGSDIQITSATDAGAFLRTDLTITRSNGNWTLGGALQSPTIVTPTIASFANATHDHTNAAGGGQLGTSALSDSAITTVKIADNNVTLAKLATMATDSFLGRDTAGTGNVEVLTPTQLVAIITSVLDDTFMLRSGGAAAQMTGQLLLAAAGIAFMNAGGTVLTAGTRPELVVTGGIDTSEFIKTTVASYTIAGGVITVTGTYCAIDTEAAAATDDLDTINGGVDGAIIIIRAANGARTVVLKDGTGNISCPSDRSLTHVDDRWVGMYNGVRWCEISFADNAA